MILKEISNGISHIEDLSPLEFIKVMNSLHEYEATEKLDGSQILFGIDEHGFYTSRETKGGRRIYNEKDYGISFSSTYMRSAHRLLEEVLPELRSAGLKRGDQVEAEVLFDSVPNVIEYSRDINYLIFLRTTEGTVNIDRLRQKLSGQSTSVTLSEPITLDGKSINLQEQIRNWKFDRVPRVDINAPKIQQHIRSTLSSMIAYLKEDSGIKNIPNLVIENLPLNKRPEWCNAGDWKFIKEEIKEKRHIIRDTLHEHFISDIKVILLEHTVNNQGSVFGPAPEDGGWIEGIVLRHPVTRKMIKIVDKNKFGIIREASWRKRNALIESARSVNDNVSFSSRLHIGLASALGHPELGTMQAKSYLKKLGNTPDEILQEFREIDFKSTKEYWSSLLRESEKKLIEELYSYKKEENIESNISVSAIKNRTMQVFAESFQKISGYMNKISKATTADDLVKILVGKYLDEIR